ncbi:MAG TPA: DegQ family serine endoprotease [Thermodesulfovibrionales bacterium]|nr:DegQ family serine endoprotease [Thermodesulfovibrionales bacterium]
MRKKLIVGVAILLTGFLLGGLSYYIIGRVVSPPAVRSPFVPRVPSQIPETGRAFSEIASAVSPAVVNISTTKVVRRETTPFSEDPFFDLFRPFHEFGLPKKWKEQSLGSGVVVSKDGYIITNNHVIEQSEDIRVILYDKRSFKGKVVGSDPKTDLAVVKISSDNLPTVPWGDSDRLQVGEFVLAIGNPFGLSHTVTMGIISAVGRANVGIADYEDFIQTDAAINPGNSGGPLVNTKGELIGINTAIFSRSGGYQGIGFAVPSNMVKLVMDQLMKQGKIVRGWLGVTIQDITPELSQKFGLKDSKGALVGDIAKDSPAEKAGIMRGDVILEFNGKEIKSVGSLRNLVSQSKVGSQVKLRILRNGKEREVSAAIAELPKEVGGVPTGPSPDVIQRNAFSGISVMDLTKEIARQLGIGSGEKGVVVVRVEPGSTADEAGLKKGDVILEIDRKRITGIGDYNKMASARESGDTALFFVNRGGRRFYITIKGS